MPDRRPKKGGIPWGWRPSDDDEMTLIPHDDEQRVIAVCRHARASGWTLQRIADFLNEVGVKNRNGKPIDRVRVYEIINGGRKPPTRGTPRKRADER